MATPNVPSVLWMGRTENEWPIQVWESETSAMSWLSDSPRGGNQRHIWIVSIEEPKEYKIVYTEPRLEPVE